MGEWRLRVCSHPSLLFAIKGWWTGGGAQAWWVSLLLWWLWRSRLHGWLLCWGIGTWTWEYKLCVFGWVYIVHPGVSLCQGMYLRPTTQDDHSDPGT